MRNILFPYDFSPPSVRAVPYVRAIAQVCPARITLFSVAPPVWEASLQFPAEGDREQILRGRLAETLVEELAGIEVTREVASGDPGTKIVEYAHSHPIDLIMMPTHGMGITRSLLIGSATAKVLHDAHCPVWTARLEHDSAVLPRIVLGAVDNTDRSVDVMRWAGGFCRQIEAELHLLNVVTPISDWLALPSERELQEQVRGEASEQMEALRQQSGVNAPLRIAVGKIANMVAEQSLEERADLIVIGRGVAQERLGRLRTHVYAIIDKARCPVVSV